MSEAIPQTSKQAVPSGEVESVNKEWNELQDHANDLSQPTPILPIRKKLYSITGADLDRSFHNDRGSTQASHIGESLDED